MIRIVPKYKLLISYDIKAENQEVYYRFMTGEFVPGLRALGFYMTDVHHTLWGEYPIRLAEFVAESMEAVKTALSSEKFQKLEDKLKSHSENYTRKVILYRDGFQL